MRHRRVWRLVLSGAVAALALGFAGLAALTRTEWGRERVLAYTLTAVGGRLNGELVVERLDGNLVTGARLHGLELRGPDGELVVRADSAYADYELATFVGGDVVLNRLVLFGSELALRRLPGDSLWNYQEVLLDTTATPGEGPGRAVLIEQARLADARVTVRIPWEVDPELIAVAQERAIRDVLSDTSRIEVDRVEGGFLRTISFDVDEAAVSDLVIAGDERGGTYVRIDTVAARARLYRGEPLDVRDAAGEIGLHEGILSFRLPEVVLPASELNSAGVIDMSGDAPRYDVTLTASRVAFEDMVWLYPPVPGEGGASFRLSLETRPEGTLYRVRELELDAPGTRLEGSFGVVMNGTLHFTDVDLTAAPLRVETIEAMLPAGLPVRGLRIGEVEIRSSGAATRAATVASTG